MRVQDVMAKIVFVVMLHGGIKMTTPQEQCEALLQKIVNKAIPRQMIIEQCETLFPWNHFTTQNEEEDQDFESAEQFQKEEAFIKLQINFWIEQYALLKRQKAGRVL